MGNSESASITTDLMVSEIKHIRSSLSERDRRLFNHAKFAIAQESESLDNTELFIDFEDRDGILIREKNVTNPSGRIFVGYDENNQPKYVWERRGFWRAAKKFFVDTYRSLLEAVKMTVPAIAAGSALKAIGYR